MRVLVVDEEIPYPLNTGKRIRTYNLLKHLAGRHEIVLVCRQNEDSDGFNAEALDRIGIQTRIVRHPIRKKSGLGFYWALAWNLLSPKPYSVTSHHSSRLVNELAYISQQRTFDLVHCEWTPYAANLNHLTRRLPSVVVAHNVESQVWRRSWQAEENRFKKRYIFLQWKKMESFETGVFPKFTKIVAVSEQDKDQISKWVPKRNIEVVENGVDVDYFRPAPTEEKPFSMVFTGSMDWRPNVDAMIFFLQQILPIVRRRYPDSSLAIVGRRPPEILVKMVSQLKGVTLSGTVNDVRPYVAEASVYVVPLRIGGGSRLKILEALAMGKAVVSTPVGAEGLEVRDGEDILIAEKPLVFAEKIGSLFENLPLRKSLGRKGLSLITRYYQWPTLSSKLESVWAEAVDCYAGYR